MAIATGRPRRVRPGSLVGVNSRARRAARGWFVAASATVLASLSHVVGGGQAPGLLAIVLALAVSGFVCMALIGPRAGMLRVGIGAVFAQLSLHVLYSVSGSPTPIAGSTGDAHASHSLAPGALAGVFGDSGAAVHAHLSAPMLLSHLGAAIITILALRQGARALDGLIDAAVLAWRTLFVPVFSSALERMPQPRPVGVPQSLARTSLVVLSPSRRRGPPVASAA